MKRFLTALLAAAIATAAPAKSFRITVDAGEYDRHGTPVKADISLLGLKEGTSLRLFETSSAGKVEKPCQSDGKFLYFILDGETLKGTSRSFEIKTAKEETPVAEMAADDDGGSVTLRQGDRNILTYKYSLTMPPEGVDEIFARSGYIHPACTPSGFQLTTIQPEDHRHHYGIWNPWTKIQYEGAEYDLWNLGDRKGTVRAREVLSEFSGKVMSGLDAVLDHNIKKGGSEKTIINETWKIRAWDFSTEGFLWDFDSELRPSTESPVLIKEYRYAGFGFRANKHWTRDNCEMISSEGRDRKSIDGTRGRWIYTQGDIGEGRKGGILMMDCPSNYNYPEPLRIWDENAAGVGYVFMNFAPTKNTDWNLEPGNTYILSYRIYAFDGTMTPQKAEELWRDFAFPPTVKITGK